MKQYYSELIREKSYTYRLPDQASAKHTIANTCGGAKAHKEPEKIPEATGSSGRGGEHPSPLATAHHPSFCHDQWLCCSGNAYKAHAEI